MATDVVVIFSTFPSMDVARKATRTLVEEKLVACGNLLPAMESIYTWQEEIEASVEILGIFKTARDRVPAVMQRLRELHPYDVPEMLQLNVEEGWPAYLQWVRNSVTQG